MLKNLKLVGFLLLTFLSTSSFVSFEDSQPNTDLSGSAQYMMELYIKDVNSNVTTLNVRSDDTILTVKTKIMGQTEMRIQAQDLIFAGKSLENDKTLEDYGIGKESTIHLVMRMARP